MYLSNTNRNDAQKMFKDSVIKKSIINEYLVAFEETFERIQSQSS